MTTETIVKITCDICNNPITENQEYVDAGVYGRDFHYECLENVNGTFIGKLVDDIAFYSTGERRLAHRMRMYWDQKIN